MSRLARRRLLTAAAATAAVLGAPAAASAATYTVKGGDGACGGGDLACGGLVEAAAAAGAGDVFNVAAGAYAGATFTVGGVTINGAPGVVIASTIEFSGASGGVSKLSTVGIAITSGTGPGVNVSGASGLELSDAGIVSAYGHGVLISAGAANKIVRSLVATGGGETSAIRVESDAGSAAKSLTVESTIVLGGASGIGAFTRAGALVLQGAGDISLDLRHVTAAGSTNGIVLNANGGASLLNPGTGSITATLADSIALSNAVTNYPGILGIGANTATLTPTRSVTAAGVDPNTLFADPAGRNFRLRPGSPAIGQGGVTAGESTTDLDGEDRAAAPTDLGGDEFFNATPVAKIVVATKVPRATQPVAFDAGTSVDREASYGGGIIQYRWTFSDGKTEATTTPTINHVFDKEGDASASLVVVDRQGAVSAPAAVALKLINGTPPSVSIVKPKDNQKIKRFTTKTTTKTVDGETTTTTTRARTKIVFSGLSTDANGVAGVLLTLEKLATTSSGKAQASQATAKKCNWFNPKKGIQRKACTKPTLITAKLKSTGQWSYTVKRNLSKGTYRLTAVGVDKTGAFGNAGSAKLGVVKFTLT